MILLITKYNISPKWVQIALFFIFYFILIKLHYFDVSSVLVTCTGKGGGVYDPTPFSEKPESYKTKTYLEEGCRFHRISKTYRSALGSTDLTKDRVDRLIEVVSSHDETIAPLVAEAKTRNIQPADVLSGMLSSKPEAIPVVPDLSNYVTLDQHRLLESRLDEYLNQTKPLAESPTTASTQDLVGEINFNSKKGIQNQIEDLRERQKTLAIQMEAGFQPLSKKINQMENEINRISELMKTEDHEKLLTRLNELGLPDALQQDIDIKSEKSDESNDSKDLEIKNLLNTKNLKKYIDKQINNAKNDIVENVKDVAKDEIENILKEAKRGCLSCVRDVARNVWKCITRDNN